MYANGILSNKLHPSPSASMPHWTLRGMRDLNGGGDVTLHLYETDTYDFWENGRKEPYRDPWVLIGTV